MRHGDVSRDDIRRVLGHSSIRTTERYLHDLDDDWMQRIRSGIPGAGD